MGRCTNRRIARRLTTESYYRAWLPSGENFLHPRFEILLALRPQPQALHRHSLFDAPNPLKESTNIVRSLFLVIPKIFRTFHGCQKPRFLRAFRARLGGLPEAE